MREVGQTKWHELALSLCEAFDEVVQMSEKRERAAKKACKRRKLSPTLTQFFALFLSVVSTILEPGTRLILGLERGI